MIETTNNKVYWVKGNTQPFIIPLEQEVMTEQDEIVAEPYYPDENADIVVNFVGKWMKYPYIPRVDGNLLIFTVNATMPAGNYDVEIVVKNQDGTQRRSQWDNQVVITNSNPSVLQEWDEFKQQDITARAALFFFAKGDTGVGVAQGGSTGQVLIKKSNTDYDTEWKDAPASGVSSVNGKSGSVTLDAQEVGALPNSTKYGSTIDLAMDSATYVLTLSLKDQDGTVLNTKTVDLPIESVVVNGRYDATNKKIVLTLQSGSTIDVPVGDLIAGLQTEITSVNMLDADLVDDTNSTHKFVTLQEKQAWNNKSDFSGSYNDLTDKPAIPDAQIQSDWNQSDSSARDYIKNKPIVPPNIKHIIRIAGSIGGEAAMLDDANDGEYWIDEDEQFGEDLFLVTDDDGNKYRTLVPYSDDTLYIDSSDIWVYDAINDAFYYILDRTAVGNSPTYYGTCSSPSSSNSLIVNCRNFKLEIGAAINVKFSSSRTVSGNCTMNVGSRGAKTVKFGHSTTVPAYAWQSGQVIKFVYDGTYFVAETAKATTTTLGLTTLTDSVSSTNTNSAATPNSVKQAYDLAASKTDKMTLVPISSVPASAVNLAINQYYRFDINLTGFTGILPTVTADDNLKSICLYFTTGDNPSITFVSSDKPLLFYDGYSIEANTTYEINIINLGTKWVLAYSIVDVSQNVGGE